MRFNVALGKLDKHAACLFEDMGRKWWKTETIQHRYDDEHQFLHNDTVYGEAETACRWHPINHTSGAFGQQ